MYEAVVLQSRIYNPLHWQYLLEQAELLGQFALELHLELMENVYWIRDNKRKRRTLDIF
jgi:hypothetical protein